MTVIWRLIIAVGLAVPGPFVRATEDHNSQEFYDGTNLRSVTAETPAAFRPLYSDALEEIYGAGANTYSDQPKWAVAILKLVTALRAASASGSPAMPSALEIVKGLNLSDIPERTEAVYALVKQALRLEDLEEVKKLITESTDPSVDRRESAAAKHILNAEIAADANKNWVAFLQSIHGEAVTPFHAYKLLRQRREFVEKEEWAKLAQALAAERYSLAEEERGQVAGLLEGDPFKTAAAALDPKLYQSYRAAYGGTPVGLPEEVPSLMGTALRNNEAHARSINEAANKVVNVDGTLNLDVEVSITGRNGENKTMTGREWVESLATTYDPDYLMRWAAARGGPGAERMLTALLRGTGDKPQEVVLQTRAGENPKRLDAETPVLAGDRVVVAGLRPDQIRTVVASVLDGEPLGAGLGSSPVSLRVAPPEDTRPGRGYLVWRDGQLKRLNHDQFATWVPPQPARDLGTEPGPIGPSGPSGPPPLPLERDQGPPAPGARWVSLPGVAFSPPSDFEPILGEFLPPDLSATEGKGRYQEQGTSGAQFILQVALGKFPLAAGSLPPLDEAKRVLSTDYKALSLGPNEYIIGYDDKEKRFYKVTLGADGVRTYFTVPYDQYTALLPTP